MVGQPILNNMYTGGGVLAYTANMVDLINKYTVLVLRPVYGYRTIVNLLNNKQICHDSTQTLIN
jgi:hypothetical protein